MKNIRKIVAILAAVLMLCTVMPISAIVSADINMDFEDGINGWGSDCGVEVVDLDGSKVLKWHASLDWANMYNYCNLSANTEYVMTMKVKADRDTNMNFKVLKGDWSATTYQTTFNVTTEWQEISVQFNSGEGSFVMLSANTKGVDGATYYVDDFSIVEYVAPVVPGQIINGDFETGDLSGWEKHQSTTISTDAHSGSYAANIKGDGGWGGMLNQDVTVEAGKTYKVSIWMKTNANGANVQIKDGGTSGANLASTWFTTTEWTNIVWEVIPTTDVICFNFCGGGNGVAEDVLVDDITVTEVKTASFDGFLTNGDFEIGDLTAWNKWQGTVISTDAHSGNYAANVKGAGNWNGMLDQNVTVEAGKTYQISLWYKANANGVNFQIKDGGTNGTNLDSGWFDKTEWTEKSWEVTPTTNIICLNFCGAGNGIAEDVLVDDIVVKEVVADPEQPDPEQPDNAVIWSVDFNDGDMKFNVGEVVAEGPDGSNCYKWDFGGGYSSNWAGGLSMDSTKDYTITMKVKGSTDGTMAITLMPGSWATWWNGPSFNVTTEWQEVVLTIPANSVVGKDGAPFNTGVFEFQGNGGEAYTLYVDDIVISEGLPPAPSNFLNNGDFETGNASGWENLWSKNTIEIVEGIDGGSALSIVSGQWWHVRQTSIAVKANTWYKLTAWAKDTKGMSLLVKNGADNFDIINKGIEAGEEWTEFTVYFNTGDFNSIIFSLMGNNADEAYGTFDNIVLKQLDCEFVETIVEPTCEQAGSKTYTCDCGESFSVEIPAAHTYANNCDADCDVCGETREPSHELTHVEAVVPANCQETGHEEYWECSGCDAIFGDAEGSYQLNPAWLNYTGECAIPEGLADCADWTCELCGTENIGKGDHDVLLCQGGTCSKCNAVITGVGCANYTTPACQDGVCYYCGGFVAGFGHANGSLVACQDGECTYDCGLVFPATEDHVDETHTDENGDVVEGSNNYCDNCWAHLACIDEDGNNECDVCWSEMPEPPVEDIVYGDLNDDGDVNNQDLALLQQYLNNWEVTPNVAAADANGDGDVNNQDLALLQQYLNNWEVTLGPV